jgi:phospholipase D3/4
MLPSHIPHNSKKPMSLTVSSASSPSSSSPSSFFLSSAPFETVGANPHHSTSRTFDLDGIVHTIRTAKSYVKLSVMDFAPSNAYDLNWWGTLNDALLAATYGSTVDVQLLISYWAHTAPGMVEYLDALKSQSNVCVANNSTCGSFEVRGRARRSKKERGGAQDRRGTRRRLVLLGYYMHVCTICTSSVSNLPPSLLQIKMFLVPGWNQTLDYPNTTKPNDPVFPTYSRVAHGKFLLTESRVNVGTSNYQWGYFYQTAGTSLNTDDAAIREGVEAAFDRDWNSSYAVDLEGFSDPNTWDNEPW